MKTLVKNCCLCNEKRWRETYDDYLMNVIKQQERVTNQNYDVKKSFNIYARHNATTWCVMRDVMECRTVFKLTWAPHCERENEVSDDFYLCKSQRIARRKVHYYVAWNIQVEVKAKANQSTVNCKWILFRCACCYPINRSARVSTSLVLLVSKSCSLKIAPRVPPP